MPNRLVNMGKRILMGRLKGVSGAGVPGATEPVHVGWGGAAIPSGGTAVTDNTLYGEHPEARTAGTSSLVTTTVTEDTYLLSATLTALAQRVINNVGAFDAPKAANAVPAGNLFVKADFPDLTIFEGDAITFNFRWQIL